MELGRFNIDVVLYYGSFSLCSYKDYASIGSLCTVASLSSVDLWFSVIYSMKFSAITHFVTNGVSTLLACIERVAS